MMAVMITWRWLMAVLNMVDDGGSELVGLRMTLPTSFAPPTLPPGYVNFTPPSDSNLLSSDDQCSHTCYIPSSSSLYTTINVVRLKTKPFFSHRARVGIRFAVSLRYLFFTYSSLDFF
ncbi:uncharacterized protein LOC129321959 [Prosopis cineraria]|uniref:uncharacterized protein LOC129321959 n=1 Tax=Prosopis cineraria TaxID=364024 RepID=UPI00240F03DD|nr:uncharacterized protein LOC129321959 [Prosopis cineraria]